jgi:hypothetical protein
MYTYNLYCFGHQLSSDKNLNNLLHEYDLEFSRTIDGKLWEVDFPYHGGQVRGDCYSCVFGTIITDDDNPDYINLIRKSNENDFIKEYKKFLDILLSELDKDVELEPEIEKVVSKLKDFLSKNEPTFYTVQVSS